MVVRDVLHHRVLEADIAPAGKCGGKVPSLAVEHAAGHRNVADAIRRISTRNEVIKEDRPVSLAVRRRTDDGRAGGIHRACGDLGRPAVRRALRAPRQLQAHMRTQREVQDAVHAGRHDHRAPARRRHAVDALLDRKSGIGTPRRVRTCLGHDRPYRTRRNREHRACHKKHNCRASLGKLSLIG